MNKYLKALGNLLFGRDVVYADYKGEVMTVKFSDGKTEQYSGSSTVWYKMPYMKRCSTSTETMLSELYRYSSKWRGPYPDAHLSVHNTKQQ